MKGMILYIVSGMHGTNSTIKIENSVFMASKYYVLPDYHPSMIRVELSSVHAT